VSEAASDLPALDALIAGIRDGDEAAVCALVARYEPMLLRVLRVTGKLRWLQGQLESSDLVQSVFIRAVEDIRTGAVSFGDEARLEAYLKTIGRRRLLEIIRHARAKKRDRGRTVAGEAAALEQQSMKDPTPSEVISLREEVARVERLADPDDLDVIRAQRDGAAWQELAAERRTTAERLRKKIERVRQKLREALADPDPEQPG
jgi:RNA polymerase sigma factor (sigma-70 family)